MRKQKLPVLLKVRPRTDGHVHCNSVGQSQWQNQPRCSITSQQKRIARNLPPLLIYNTAHNHTGAADLGFFSSLGASGPVGCGMGIMPWWGLKAAKKFRVKKDIRQGQWTAWGEGCWAKSPGRPRIYSGQKRLVNCYLSGPMFQSRCSSLKKSLEHWASILS